MTLTQLEYFCMVCRYRSITRAADALFVSQPTISTSIRDLEKEFHLKLFNHGKNRISLTQELQISSRNSTISQSSFWNTVLSAPVLW